MTSQLKFLRRADPRFSFRRYIQYIKCSIVTYKRCTTDKIYATQSLKTIYYPVRLALHCNFKKKVKSQKHNSVKAEKYYNCLTLRDVLI